MRKLSVLFGAALLALAGAANAQTCLQFDNFCDAIQINGISEAGISAEWSSWDCAGSDAPMQGFLTGGRATLVCSDAACPFGDDWAYAVAFPISAFWLYSITQGTLFQSQSPYTQIPGACTNAPVGNARAVGAAG
jgi:hypothetical protein